MQPRSFYKLLIASLTALLVAVCVWVFSPEYSTSKHFGEKFAPTLMEKINNISVFSVETKDSLKTFLRKEDGEWVLLEAEEYPANKERIRNVLLGLASLEKVEPKTSLEEFYPDLEIEENTLPQANSRLVSLFDETGEGVLQVLIGKQKDGIMWSTLGYYVRKPQEAQSWLVRGNADVTGPLQSWVDSKILPLVKGRAKSITVVNNKENREGIFKRISASTRLEPTFVSDGYFVISKEFIEKMEDSLTNFYFEKPLRRPLDFEKMTPFSSLFVETFDGLNVYLFLYLIENKAYAAVSFEATEEAPQEVKEEALSLQKRHGEWMYLMAPNKVGALLPFLDKPQKK